jgi:hypothetical protein
MMMILLKKQTTSIQHSDRGDNIDDDHDDDCVAQKHKRGRCNTEDRVDNDDVDPDDDDLKAAQYIQATSMQHCRQRC